MRVLVVLGLILLIAGCGPERAPRIAESPAPPRRTPPPLTLQIFQVRSDLEETQQELGAFRRELARAALDPEERQRLEEAAGATQVALDRALARVTELEAGGGWPELEALRRQSRALAQRLAALRVALESATR